MDETFRFLSLRTHAPASRFMNSYLGIGIPQSWPGALAYRAKRVWVSRCSGSYRCLVTSLRILATTDFKDSMSFLIANPPLHGAVDQQGS